MRLALFSGGFSAPPFDRGLPWSAVSVLVMFVVAIFVVWALAIWKALELLLL